MKGTDLIFTDGDEIFRLTPDHKITEFITTEDWTPIGLHASRINGDILVGMYRDREAKVTRYSKTGKELQSIQRDDQGLVPYDYPSYITENINGDICTSDIGKCAVVVVTKSGQYRFSYLGLLGFSTQFSPSGICTDIHGNILVCDMIGHSVKIFDQDGEDLAIIFSTQGIKSPCSLSVDDENNVHVGQLDTNIITVYRYLQ